MAQAIGAVVSFFSTVFWKTTAFAVGAGASATIGVIVGALAVGAVIAGGVALMKTLAPKMPDLNALTNRGQNVRSPISTRKLIYGEAKVGGTILFISEGNTNSDREYLYLLFALASHECQSIDKVYIGDEECTLDGSGQVTVPTRYVKSGTYHARFILDMLGASTSQTLDSIMTTDTDLTATDHFKGMTVAQARLKYDPDGMFASGIPQLNFLVKGKKVYDPRDSGQAVDSSATWTYSDNPALVVADFLRSEFGLNVPHANIDWTTVTASANTCDELVTLADSSTEKRYTCNGMLDTGTPVQNNLDALLSSMAGSMIYENGKYKILAGEYRTPTLTITETDLRAGINIQTKTPASEQINTVTGLYVGSDTNYQPANYPIITNSTYVTEDGQEQKAEINLSFTNTSTMAQRIAKIFLERARKQYTMTLGLNLEKFTLSPGDTVKVTLESLGFDEKVFEVVEWSFGAESDILGVDVLLKETASTVYGWSSSEEQSQGTVPSLIPTYDQTVATPTFSLTQDQSKAEDGTIIDDIIVDISDPLTDPHVKFYQVFWKENSESDYKVIEVEREI